jgi:hypothetical protein
MRVVCFDTPDRSDPGCPRISHACHPPPAHGSSHPQSDSSRNRYSNRTGVGYRPSFFSLFCFSSQPTEYDYTQKKTSHQTHVLSDIADNPSHSSVSARAELVLCLIFFELVNHFKIDLDWKNICRHKTITAIKNIINEG